MDLRVVHRVACWVGCRVVHRVACQVAYQVSRVGPYVDLQANGSASVHVLFTSGRAVHAVTKPSNSFQFLFVWFYTPYYGDRTTVIVLWSPYHGLHTIDRTFCQTFSNPEIFIMKVPRTLHKELLEEFVNRSSSELFNLKRERFNFDY